MPLSDFLGIKKTKKQGYLLKLDLIDPIKIHDDRYHASALFSFAEISAGCLLVYKFPQYKNKVAPLLRKAESNFMKPAQGRLYSKPYFLDQLPEEIDATLQSKGKVNISIVTELYDSHNVMVFKGLFKWFVFLPDRLTTKTI